MNHIIKKCITLLMITVIALMCSSMTVWGAGESVRGAVWVQDLDTGKDNYRIFQVQAEDRTDMQIIERSTDIRWSVSNTADFQIQYPYNGDDTMCKVTFIKAFGATEVRCSINGNPVDGNENRIMMDIMQPNYFKSVSFADKTKTVEVGTKTTLVPVAHGDFGDKIILPVTTTETLTPDLLLEYGYWSVSDIQVLSVDQKGVITAKRPGTTRVTFCAFDRTNNPINRTADAVDSMGNDFRPESEASIMITVVEKLPVTEVSSLPSVSSQTSSTRKPASSQAAGMLGGLNPSGKSLTGSVSSQVEKPTVQMTTESGDKITVVKDGEPVGKIQKGKDGKYYYIDEHGNKVEITEDEYNTISDTMKANKQKSQFPIIPVLCGVLLLVVGAGAAALILVKKKGGKIPIK